MGMAAATRDWTVEMLDALPDDGQRYEIIDGELFVTPAPGEGASGCGRAPFCSACARHLADSAILAKVIVVTRRTSGATNAFPQSRATRRVLRDSAFWRIKRPEYPFHHARSRACWPQRLFLQAIRLFDYHTKRAICICAKGWAEYWVIDPETRNVF